MSRPALRVVRGGKGGSGKGYEQEWEPPGGRRGYEQEWEAHAGPAWGAGDANGTQRW